MSNKDNKCKNFFKTKDEKERKILYNEKWVELINYCEKNIIRQKTD